MERVFAELVRRLHRRYEVVVLASELAPELRDLVEWRRVPAPRRPASVRFAVFYVLGAVRLWSVRAQLVQTLGAIVPNRVDVASVHFCHAAFRAAAGGLAPPRAPLLRRANTALARLACIAAERWSYRPKRTRVLAPVSRGLAGELASCYPGMRIAVTPNGVDRRRFRPEPLLRRRLRAELHVPDGDFVGLFVGGDWDRKGLALGIEGLAHARTRTARPLWLWVVGAGDEARFRALAQKEGVADRVVFFGPRRDAERFYSSADAFVFPTAYEAFPLVALEAAAAGLPIVAPLVNGIEELVGKGEAGIPVERTAASVGAALRRLAEDGILHGSLAAGARRRSEAFTWDRSADDVMALYAELLGADRATNGRAAA